jgi:hypothetical protein
MEIRIEHAASSEAFDDAQLLDPKQNKGRPHVIEKLHGNEQNPERILFFSFLSAKATL